jgi:hypothetical protein
LNEVKHLSFSEYVRMYTTTDLDVETISRIVLGLEELIKLKAHGEVKIIVIQGQITEIDVIRKERLVA